MLLWTAFKDLPMIYRGQPFYYFIPSKFSEPEISNCANCILEVNSGSARYRFLCVRNLLFLRNNRLADKLE